MNQDFECPRCGHCCQLPEAEQKPVAWMHTTGTGHVYFRKKPQDKVYSPQPVYTVPPKREWAGLTDREVELIDEMIETQLLHAERCGHMANSTMAQKQKAWDLERVELLRKLKEKNGGEYRNGATTERTKLNQENT